MEPENRPYVDADTKPGDAGTETWADTPPGEALPKERGPLVDPVGTAIDDGIIDGSPADEFINDPSAIEVRNEEPVSPVPA